MFLARVLRSLVHVESHVHLVHRKPSEFSTLIFLKHVYTHVTSQIQLFQCKPYELSSLLSITHATSQVELVHRKLSVLSSKLYLIHKVYLIHSLRCSILFFPCTRCKPNARSSSQIKCTQYIAFAYGRLCTSYAKYT